ncbi:MAG: PQQ-like beta-propeller repeat protein [bacterium]|nr:PQQ-like beta-propeller repeat protein [bacterium]
MIGPSHSRRLLCPLVSLAIGLALPAGAGADPYSPGGWPTLHRDAGNRRSTHTTVLPNRYKTWRALKGATVLTAPTTSPDGRQIYVTTGQPPGQSNLHAFSITGDLLWQSEPWQSADAGVDACAILSSPIVDANGDVFINDCNQMFAFSPNGHLRWATSLPPVQPGDWIAAGDHPVNAFTTAIFTPDGNLLGVTNFGDVVIFDRSTGEVLNEAYRLPGLVAPFSEVMPLPESAFGEGMMDPKFRQWVWQLIFGGSMRSANTPSVTASGRVFVVGSAEKEGLGALYGLDLQTGEGAMVVREAFATDIGIGSGSSPALSPNEDRVYVSDEAGWLYGVDSRSGQIAWKVKTLATAGAVAVGSDGTIYALQAGGPAIIAVDPEGTILWESDFTQLARQLPSSFLFGDPVAIGNGNPTVTKDAVLVPVIYGYQANLGRPITLPVRSTLAALDLATGKAIRDVVELPDDSSGITAVLADGTLINSLAGIFSSSIRPLAPWVGWLMPGDLQILAPHAGIQVALKE